METALLTRLQSTTPNVVATALRIGAGLVFVAYSLGKFRRRDAEVAAFDRYGVPAPEVTVALVGLLELIGGALLIVGLLARPVSLALTGNMVGALATAGRVDPNFNHVGLPIILICALLVVIVLGAGRWSVDRRLSAQPTMRP